LGATAWVAVAVFLVAYALIATERVHRVAAALGGAAVMLVVGATDAEAAWFAEDSGIDWNVIFLLLGMMLVVAVLKRTGVFEYLAIWAAKRARGRPYPLMVILVLVTAGASALLDNVTTVLLVAPVTILVCERLAVPAAPYLIAEVMASNIGGTSTLIGDPPNIIVASRAGFSFNDFLTTMAPIVVVLVAVFVLLCRVLFRSAFRHDPQRADGVLALRERDAIRDPRLLVVSLTVLVLMLAAFMLHTVLHLEPAVVAIVGGLLLLAVSGLDVGEVVRDVEWETLAFFAGLFVMVGALVHTGVLAEVSRGIGNLVDGRLFGASMLLLGGSAVISGVVDNIPYVASLSPIVADLVAAETGRHAADPDVLWWSMLLGADLGGNATAIGASANVVVLGIAARSGHPITFWQFTRYGLVVTAVTVGLCVPYVWLRWFAFA
jgi:Na+/H+ antiporter NhaD/arsenite permease-like protein